MWRRSPSSHCWSQRILSVLCEQRGVSRQSRLPGQKPFKCAEVKGNLSTHESLTRETSELQDSRFSIQRETSGSFPDAIQRGVFIHEEAETWRRSPVSREAILWRSWTKISCWKLWKLLMQRPVSRSSSHIWNKLKHTFPMLGSKYLEFLWIKVKVTDFGAKPFLSCPAFPDFLRVLSEKCADCAPLSSWAPLDHSGSVAGQINERKSPSSGMLPHQQFPFRVLVFWHCSWFQWLCQCRELISWIRCVDTSTQVQQHSNSTKSPLLRPLSGNLSSKTFIVVSSWIHLKASKTWQKVGGHRSRIFQQETLNDLLLEVYPMIWIQAEVQQVPPLLLRLQMGRGSTLHLCTGCTGASYRSSRVHQHKRLLHPPSHTFHLPQQFSTVAFLLNRRQYRHSDFFMKHNSAIMINYMKKLVFKEPLNNEICVFDLFL